LAAAAEVLREKAEVRECVADGEFERGGIEVFVDSQRPGKAEGRPAAYRFDFLR